jgi:hypothetical protein
MKIMQKLKHKEDILWVSGAFLAAGLLFLFTTYGRFPVEIRTLAATIRYSFVSTSIFILIIFYVILRLPGRWSLVAAFAVGAALFGLALGGLWASGQSEPYVVSGLIPYNDAATYSIDANRLLDGSRLSTVSSRRPFFTGMLGAVLGLTGRNLQHAIAVLVFLLAISCVYLTLEVRRIRGSAAGAVTIWIVFLFARRFAGTTMTETLGLSLGALGLAFLILGIYREKLSNLLAGLFLLALALNARAGAFFLLPVLILWIGWLFRKQKLFGWKEAGLALLAVVIAFGLNSLVLKMIGEPGGMLFGNFSESLYGLAAGGERWAEVYNRHPELYQLPATLKDQEIYRLSFELIRTNPMNLVKGMLYQWGLLFSETWFSVYAYVGGESIADNWYVHWGLYALCLATLIQAIKNWRVPLNSFLLVSVLGIFISVPFVPPGDAHKMRAFAATIPLLALLPGVGAAWLVSLIPWKKLKEHEFHLPELTGLSTYSSFLVAFMVIAPIIVLKTAIPPVITAPVCEPDEQPVSMYYMDGNAVNLIREEILQLDWLPEFHYGRYKIFIHNLPNDEAINVLNKVEPPATLLLGYDISSGRKVWLLAGTDQMPATYGVIQVCGKYQDTNDPNLLRYGFYYPRQIKLAP